MTGKKVFTGAGEYLASFLLTLKKEETETKNLNDTLAEITGTSAATNAQAVSLYQSTKTFTKEELLTFVKLQFRKEIGYYKSTTSGKEISTQEMTQILYNTLQWVSTETDAKFEALTELVFDNLASIFKTIGSYNRNYLRNIKIIKQSIADFKFFALDDFVGDDEDKKRLYFKMDGAILRICDGAGPNHTFKEIFRIKAKEYIANQSYLGDELIIGGTETTSPFKTIRFVKDIFSEGNITMGDGKELIGTALRARYADLAEYYTSNMEYRPGTLLQIDIHNQNEVTIYDPTDRTNCENSGGCVGVVSDKPGFILNDDLKSDFSIVPVVLTGKTPVRIIGTASKGDFIYPSPTIPGVAIAIHPMLSFEFESQYPLYKKLGRALESTQPNVLDTNNDIESLINIKVN